MKKKLFFMGFMALSMSLSLTSCGGDDDDDPIIDQTSEISEEQAQNLDYSSELANAWGNYAVNVAKLLKDDATALYNAWNSGFADEFKSHSSSDYTSAESCVEEIFQGSIDIAGEVGEAKIGEPVDYWTNGQRNKALYAVESWYSWHSRDDYKNNILSIANSFLGKRISLGANEQLTTSVADQAAANSLYTICSRNTSLADKTADVWSKICTAWQAIDAIPQPFRNNIGSDEAANAMDACAELGSALKELQALVADNLTETECQAIVDNFVDNVVLPTYADLKTKVEALHNAVTALNNNPSNATFEAAAQAWLDARQPWESSEAFLFGPVAELGLDPNMDSWPLDAVGIYNLLQSQNWSEMNWSGDYDEDSEAIEAAQSLRGFHTLEFLIFKNGQARTVAAN